MTQMRALFAASLLMVTPAFASVVTADPFPALQPGPIAVRLNPVLTIPADGAGSTLARITGAVSDGTGRVFVNDLPGVVYRTDLTVVTSHPNSAEDAA